MGIRVLAEMRGDIWTLVFTCHCAMTTYYNCAYLVSYMSADVPAQCLSMFVFDTHFAKQTLLILSSGHMHIIDGEKEREKKE